MKIDSEMRDAFVGVSDPAAKPDRTGDSFSSMLDADRARAQSEAARNTAIAKQNIVPKNDNTDDIEFIREKGVRAYAEEVHERKKAELRQKILTAMGLTEETLSKMTPEQRHAIEEMIAEKIKERMATESITNGDSDPVKDKDSEQVGQAAVGDINPANILAAQVLMHDSGAMIGLLAADQERDPDLMAKQKKKDTLG